ncbi:MAG: ABC transporter ATP-binding protein [Finegoldia sp.]|nr:ABC transporter ATP-binding protein [Finegoldia sp.]
MKLSNDNGVIVKNLSFRYSTGTVNIFNDINIEVPGGQFVCLLGKSGSGKSTLLRLLAGLEKPSSGEIYFGGEKNTKPGLDKGVVFQDYGLYPWMSAGKNIELAIGQKFKNLGKSERENIAVDMIEKVGLKPEIYNLLPKELSGGMRQRCAIARAFAIDPPILLMDEPFGALDAVTRASLQDMLLDLWKDATPRKTVFFVTHDVDEALLLAEKIFVIGQSGSDIIYETTVSDEQRASRDGVRNEKTVELRNELVYQINKDVQEKIKNS